MSDLPLKFTPAEEAYLETIREVDGKWPVEWRSFLAGWERRDATKEKTVDEIAEAKRAEREELIEAVRRFVLTNARAGGYDERSIEHVIRILETTPWRRGR